MSQSSQTHKQSLLSQCPGWQHIGVVCGLIAIGGAVGVAAGVGGAAGLFVVAIQAVWNAQADIDRGVWGQKPSKVVYAVTRERVEPVLDAVREQRIFAHGPATRIRISENGTSLITHLVDGKLQSPKSGAPSAVQVDAVGMDVGHIGRAEPVIAVRAGRERGLDDPVGVLGQGAGNAGAAGSGLLLGRVRQVRLLPFDGGRLELSGVLAGPASLASNSAMCALNATACCPCASTRRTICSACASIRAIRSSRERVRRAARSTHRREPSRS